jgi:hypothetical protein
MNPKSIFKIQIWEKGEPCLKNFCPGGVIGSSAKPITVAANADTSFQNKAKSQVAGQTTLMGYTSIVPNADT